MSYVMCPKCHKVIDVSFYPHWWSKIPCADCVGMLTEDVIKVSDKIKRHYESAQKFDKYKHKQTEQGFIAERNIWQKKQETTSR